MDKYINAEQLKQAVETSMDMQDLYLPSHFFDVIDGVPSAERQGRWEQVGDNAYRCSVCGEISCCNSPFCGECGARMDEVEE